jgi:hypothetical protein
MEKEDLAETLPELTLSMETKLNDWEKMHKPRYVPSVKREREDLLSQEIREGLKALGYLQ